MGMSVRMSIFVSLILDARVRMQHLKRFPNSDCHDRYIITSQMSSEQDNGFGNDKRAKKAAPPCRLLESLQAST